MPKIVYKPPVSVQKKDFGTRERSQRERKKVKKFGTEKIVKQKKGARSKNRKWTLKEKQLAEKRLEEFGTSDPKALLDPQIKKTEDQFKDLIQFNKKNNKMQQVLRPEPKHINDKMWVPRNIDGNIEKWIALAESQRNAIPRSGSQGVMDCSHILSDVLSVIINEEKHPLPGKIYFQNQYFFFVKLK